MTIILIVSMYFLVKTAASYTMSKSTDNNKLTVVIDPGHGGSDPGKVGINDALEKDINLQISLKVKKFLEANNIKVVMTRETDEGLYRKNDSNKKASDIKKRVEIMEKPGTLLAVSIHQNSYGTENVSGAQVFYYTTSEEGKKAAEIMQQQLIDGIDPENHRQSKANNTYYVLKKSTTPAIIVECGFLSNYEEASLLVSDIYQERMAWEIHIGILKYLNSQ